MKCVFVCPQVVSIAVLNVWAVFRTHRWSPLSCASQVWRSSAAAVMSPCRAPLPCWRITFPRSEAITPRWLTCESTRVCVWTLNIENLEIEFVLNFTWFEVFLKRIFAFDRVSSQDGLEGKSTVVICVFFSEFSSCSTSSTASLPSSFCTGSSCWPRDFTPPAQSKNSTASLRPPSAAAASVEWYRTSHSLHLIQNTIPQFNAATSMKRFICGSPSYQLFWSFLSRLS